MSVGTTMNYLVRLYSIIVQPCRIKKVVYCLYIFTHAIATTLKRNMFLLEGRSLNNVKFELLVNRR